MIPMPQRATTASHTPATPFARATGRSARRARIGSGTLARALQRIPPGLLILVAVAAAFLLVAANVSPRTQLRLQAKAASLLTEAPVLLVGDSIAYQAAPGELCGASAFNAAIPGDHVADLLADARDYAARLPAKRVVISVGLNDAWPHHRDLGAFIADYRRLVARYAGRDLLLVGIDRPDPNFPDVVRHLDLGFIAKANAAIRDIADKNGAQFVPPLDRMQTQDGLHPTPAGKMMWRARLTQAACA